MNTPVDWMLVATAVGPLAAVAFGAWLNHLLEGRPSLLSYIVHSSAITTKRQPGGQAPITIHTHSVVVRNTSRRAATNVRLGHQNLPDFTIFPPVQHDVVWLPDGSAEIHIPQLVRSEQITVSYLYFPPITYDKVNLYTKSDEGFAKVVPVQLFSPPPRPVQLLVQALFVLGAVTAVYWIAKLLQSAL
jgi:hypothetical protein